MEEPFQLVGSYPGARVQAPFMGHGVYCFDNFEDSKSYQSNCEVVEVMYSDDHSRLDLDDEMELVKISNYLDELSDIIEKKIDSEARPGWLNLIELLKLCVYEEFLNSQPAVGLILHILEHFDKLSSSDLLIRSFYDKIGVVGKPKLKKRYILIKNRSLIEEIS